MSIFIRIFRTIAAASRQCNRPCAEIFFDEWGTSGRKRPTVRLLYDYLERIKFLRAADFIKRNFFNRKSSSLHERMTVSFSCMKKFRFYFEFQKLNAHPTVQKQKSISKISPYKCQNRMMAARISTTLITNAVQRNAENTFYPTSWNTMKVLKRTFQMIQVISEKLKDY